TRIPAEPDQEIATMRFDLFEGDPGVRLGAGRAREKLQARHERLDSLARAGLLERLHQRDATQLRPRQNLPERFPGGTDRRQRLQWDPSPMLGGWYPRRVRGVNRRGCTSSPSRAGILVRPDCQIVLTIP